MIESILDTKVKMKIAKLFAERNEVLQVSDVARILKLSKSRTSECLRELAEKGILESKVIGRSLIYNLSSTAMAKTVSKALTQEKALLTEIEKELVQDIKRLKPISLALFGSSLKGLKTGSDIDLILIYDGKIEKEKFYEISSTLSAQFGFHISILTMSLKEFKEKSKRGEEFVLNILATHKLLYGKPLEDLIW
jgi:predicted nucleotidyltransferase